MSVYPNNTTSSFDDEGKLEQFVIQVPTVPADIEGQAVETIFEGKPELEGIVITENNRPAGILMRTTFYQKVGSLYGHSLYMKRPITILMDSAFMKVDVADNISKIGVQAMSREPDKLYDYIVVYKNKTYLGVISIRLFLLELSKRNEAQISVLKNQQHELLSAHEQEVLLRKDLEYQSASIRNLLDHADQGFLWFGRDLSVKKEFSYKCVDIFQKRIGAVNYLELIAAYFDGEKAPVFKLAFDSYFTNNSPVTDNVYLMLLPSDCVIEGKNIHFQYRRIESDGQKAVMVILNDITEKISMEKAIEEDRNKQRLIIKAFSCQAQIKQLLGEFREIFSGGYRNYFQGSGRFSEELSELFRAVHTFKGEFAQYGFMAASDEIHHFEDRLQEIVNHGASADMNEVETAMGGADPEQMLEDDLNIIYEILGESYFDKSEVLAIPRTKLLMLEKQLQNGKDSLDRTAVIRLIKSLERTNIKGYLEQYRDYLQYLAGRVMKQMPIFIVEGDDVEVDPDSYGNFVKSLVHIFRNIMDHGIETDEERLNCGKTETGLIECRISRLDDTAFTLSISDDGRGIDLEKVKQKALENHLVTEEAMRHMTQEEICNLIFADHLSTKDNADALSGRGLGMSAVKAACEKLGGKVAIVTEEKKGTTFSITLPYLNA